MYFCSSYVVVTAFTLGVCFAYYTITSHHTTPHRYNDRYNDQQIIKKESPSCCERFKYDVPSEETFELNYSR